MKTIDVDEIKQQEHILFCGEHYNPLRIVGILEENGIKPIGIIIKNSYFIGIEVMGMLLIFWVLPYSNLAMIQDQINQKGNIGNKYVVNIAFININIPCFCFLYKR